MSKKLNNLTSRVIVALIGIPLIVALCLIGKIPFLIFVLFIGLISFNEYSSMLRSKNSFPNKLIGFLAVAVLIINEYKLIIDYHLLFTLIIIFLLLFELFRNKSSAINNIGSTLLGIFYIGIFSASIINLRQFYADSVFTYSQGGYLILSILISIWLCDSAAYFIGSAYGLHKLIPRISPKKSWEGAIAGFIFSVVGMVVSKSFMLEFLSLADAIIIGIIIGVFGQIGDLVESLIKRDTNVKDSSSIIPGHGGILDRFDSLLFTAPIVYLYLLLIK
ncbi:phosphatidate cytidylyltransferase [Stygiobacter electus]|jgi:phosphatidate cytidylyltransferase|uniref:Phosphatidate cytidylyltransferase n=1 Tax=Stygiobacter electus TaxID=3032292 RepID=A0AAE3NYT0_9BACT|nr:phosphatidate cytidylyltransferase [Stygiobacter electus]MDF1611134.1 phosphatidate cytidylyltransferase [Stygiobacter electus]